MFTCFVEPGPPGQTVYDFAMLPRLGLPLIGALLNRSGHEVKVYSELLGPVDLAECQRADLVGISSTTSTAPAAYRLADALGRSGVPVVLGGPHVSFRADEALGHAPFVVRGEGQQTIAELVEILARGGGPTDLEQVAGLSWLGSDGCPHHNPARPLTSQADFAALPSPDLSLLAGHERMVTKPVMTQWGCPFDCEFCSVTAMFSRQVRHRPVEAVVGELEALEAERVFFYDDNFVVNKARTSALLEAMVAHGLTAPWFAQLRADSVLGPGRRGELDHGFLALMHRAGARMAMIGFEAVTDKGLAEVGKRSSVATAERAVQAFHDHGIAVHGMFVAGLDSDDATAAGATAGFAMRTGIDTYQLMAQTPLPGTRLWDKVTAEGRLLSDDWSLFDGHHVVMRPASMSPLELQLGILESTKRFYSWPRAARSAALAVLTQLPSLLGAARPGLLASLPALARSARAGRWGDVAPLLRAKIPAQARNRAVEALWLPAVRLYARRQLSAWWASERSRDHLQYLSTLSA